jgi:large subunit ribosomal protein L35
MKTHSGAKKRFSVTKNGKVKHRKAGLRHLLTGMKASRGRRLHKTGILHTASAAAILKKLPYA